MHNILTETMRNRYRMHMGPFNNNKIRAELELSVNGQFQSGEKQILVNVWIQADSLRRFVPLFHNVPLWFGEQMFEPIRQVDN